MPPVTLRCAVCAATFDLGDVLDLDAVAPSHPVVTRDETWIDTPCPGAGEPMWPATTRTEPRDR